MSWNQNLVLGLSVLLILIGIALALPRKGRLTVGLLVDDEPRYRLAPASSHELGLAHRLLSRLLASRLRPADENFVIAAQLWPTGMPAAHAARFWDLTLPLLGLEDLLERLEAFRARITRWGRRRERS